MKILRSKKSLKGFRSLVDPSKKVAFVPTMGYLHEGHLSLVRKAKRQSDLVIVSIFVNPLQFSPGEDLEKYPRDEKNDLKILSKLDVDAVFIPEQKEMYFEKSQIIVTHKTLSKKYCGASRPNFFDGILTVVLKLLHMVNPHAIYFGKKDYQQLFLIREMVRALDMEVAVHSAPTVRDKNGLALSSRNAYLSDREKEQAVFAYRQLAALALELKNLAKKNKEVGGSQLKSLLFKTQKKIDDYPHFRIDYLVCLDRKTLDDAKSFRSGKAVLLLAVYFSCEDKEKREVRLIDNIEI